jgi:capsid protein
MPGKEEPHYPSRRERSRTVVKIQREWTTGYTRWIDGHREMEEDEMVTEAGFTVVAILLYGPTPSR